MLAPKFIKKRSFLFITLFALMLMSILFFMNTRSTNSIYELQKGNELAGRIFQINNALQEIINNIYTAENSFSTPANVNNENLLKEKDDAIQKMNQNMQLITQLTKSIKIQDNINRLSLLIKNKTAFLNTISDSANNKLKANEMLFSTKNKLLNDSIYVTALSLQIQAENELQKKINQNFAVSRQAMFTSKALTLLALGAILLLCTIIIIHLLRNSRLIKALELSKINADNAANIKEQFLANMSHEIRTPVNSIIGFTNLLQKTPLISDQEQFVSHIKTSGENLLHIVNDILDISKIEAGRLNFQDEPFNVRELCYYLEMMFYNESKVKKIDFTYHIDKEVPEIIIGDEERLKQILTNLVGNAFKFTDKGSIQLFIKQSNKSGNNFILNFKVQDTGIGIPPEKLETIFERFEQADSKTTKNYGGTGLGLSIVKKLVEMQGGNISVESEPEKGSSFSFYIPYQLNKERNISKSLPENSTEDIIFDPECFILAAEDNKMNQLLLQYIFKQWNVKHAIAQNGEEVIELLKKQSFDLVLMDIQMPVMDGYTAARWIRNELKSDIPIIAMTAFVLEAEKDKCFAFGMNEYFPKPINELKLKELLSKYLPVNKTGSFVNSHFLKETFANNTQFIVNILELFIKQYPQDLALLKNAINNKDIIQIKALAHHLKSTCSSVNDKPAHIDKLQLLEELNPDSPDWKLAHKELNYFIESEQSALNEAAEKLKTISVLN